MPHFSATNVRLACASLALLFSLPHLAFADSITLTSTALPTTTLAPSSDTFSLNDGAVTIDPSTGPFVFQSGDFIIGNSNIPDQVIPFTFQDSLTLNGITEVLTFSGQDAVTDTADTLTIFGSAPVQFGDEAFTLQSFTLSSGAMGDLPVNLEATVTPEPGSLILLGTGLLGGAVLALRKRPLPGA